MIRILIIAIALVACGPSARLKTIRATYDATNIASEHLLTYADEREAAIVADTASGQVQLSAWREKIDYAEKVLAAVYKAIATAAMLNDDRSVGSLIKAAVTLRTELQALGVTP